MKDYNIKQICPVFLPYKYRKKIVMVYAYDTQEPFQCSVNSYWDGGSKSYYVMYELINPGRNIPLTTDPTTSFPKFTDRSVEVPVGYCIAESGVFCGKPAHCKIYIHTCDLPKLLV
jgi:hypothetical protein